ncbi:MAG: hypothetical protein RJB31_1830 [Bacteroidota bacterium]
MEVITIETQAYKTLLEKIDAMHAELQRMKNPVDQFTHEWVDSECVMKMLGISRRTLCNYVSQGKIKSSKIGKRCFYKVQEVKQMMNDSDASSKSLLSVTLNSNP